MDNIDRQGGKNRPLEIGDHVACLTDVYGAVIGLPENSKDSPCQIALGLVTNISRETGITVCWYIGHELCSPYHQWFHQGQKVITSQTDIDLLVKNKFKKAAQIMVEKRFSHGIWIRLISQGSQAFLGDKLQMMGFEDD